MATWFTAQRVGVRYDFEKRNVVSLEPEIGEAVQQLYDSVVEEPPTIDEITRRAYEIYLERGGGPGHELDDLLQAERELKKDAS
jgi:hypothetical protein